MDDYIFWYDLNQKQVISECLLNPTEVKQDETCYWLYARNNKYNEDAIDSDKVGKWMLFISPTFVNSVWNQIKEAIRQGHLWNSKVSASNPTSATHAIMIYTKDFTDVDDVISVLDYLEASGIKQPKTVVRYKTDQQTMAGVYSGGSQRPWIYASNTIRQKHNGLQKITQFFRR